MADFTTLITEIKSKEKGTKFLMPMKSILKHYWVFAGESGFLRLRLLKIKGDPMKLPSWGDCTRLHAC